MSSPETGRHLQLTSLATLHKNMGIEDGRCQDIFNAVPPSQSQMTKGTHNNFKKYTRRKF